jgi:hypothetical protein
MRHALLLLLVASTATADPTPRQPRVSSGIAGKLTTVRTSGVPGGRDSGGALDCAFEIVGGAKTIRAKTNAAGEFHVELLPGTYTLRFDACTKVCHDVRPKPPASIEVRRGDWNTVNFACMFFGK